MESAGCVSQYVDICLSSVRKTAITDGFVDVGSIIATRSHDIHRMRRSALNPCFSRQSLKKLEPIIRERVSTLLERLATHCANGDVAPMTGVFRALTSDIIEQYAFGTSGNRLSQEDYNSSFYEGVMAFFEGLHLSIHVGWLGPLLDSLPVSMIESLVPTMVILNQMRKVSSH